MLALSIGGGTLHNACRSPRHLFRQRHSAPLLHARRGVKKLGWQCRESTTAEISDRSPAAFTGQRLPLEAVVADGTHQYAGRVVAKVLDGVFVDLGAERQGFLPCSAETAPKRGSRITVYPVRKWTTAGAGGIDLALEPEGHPRISWEHVNVDGVTPYKGRVASVDALGALVDIGCDVMGFLYFKEALESNPCSLVAGAELTVYLISRDRKLHHLRLSLQPRSCPLTELRDFVSDGQTPYVGKIKKMLTTGALVDLNGEGNGFMPAPYPLSATPKEGEEVTVYVHQKLKDSGRLCVSLEPASKPRKSLEQILSDGVTPHTGQVTIKCEFGVFVDIHAEVPGLLPKHMWWDKAGEMQLNNLKEGQSVTVYVVSKNLDSGKVTLGLNPWQKPLTSIEAIRADGITPHKGIVTSDRDVGLFVHFGADMVGILRRAKGERVLYEHTNAEFEALDLAPGREVEVYVMRKNPVSGKVDLSLHPSVQPHLSLDDVRMRCGEGGSLDGLVYHVAHNEVLIDFGCEVTGILPRRDLFGAKRGQRIVVEPVEFDERCGRFLLRLASTGSAVIGEEDVVRWRVDVQRDPTAPKRMIDKRTGAVVLEAPKTGWVEVALAHGQVYYWNLDTGETTWSRPAQVYEKGSMSSPSL